MITWQVSLFCPTSPAHTWDCVVTSLYLCKHLASVKNGIETCIRN